MKRFIFLFLLLSFSCKSTDKNQSIHPIKNILFIGNSLTYFHDMPFMVQEMLNETRPGINVEQSTFPGMSLESHLSAIIEYRTENGIGTRKKVAGEQTETEIKLKEKKWDIIIFQGGTVSFLISESRRFSDEVAISKIKSINNNPNCRYLLFSTWPSKLDYPKKYCYSCDSIDSQIKKRKCCSENITSLEQHVDLINYVYSKTSKSQNLEKSNNTNKVFEILKNHKQLNLYEDNSHPNELGSFLNACIFYQMITGKKASNLKYKGNIPLKDSKLLKKIAK